MPRLSKPVAEILAAAKVFEAEIRESAMAGRYAEAEGIRVTVVECLQWCANDPRGAPFGELLELAKQKLRMDEC